MNRRYFLCGAASLGADRAIAQDARRASAQESGSRRRVEKSATAAMAMQRRDWEQGIFAQAMFEADNQDFKEVWKYQIQIPWAAIRLKNGNTLITGERDILTREVNPAEETRGDRRQERRPDC